MDWQVILKNLIPVIGQIAVDELAKKISDLSQGMDDAWKKTILTLMAEAIEKKGPLGIALAMTAVRDLLAGKTPKIDWADLRTASDILAHFQNAEADNKKAVEDFIAQASEVLGIILAALIKGLVAAG